MCITSVNTPQVVLTLTFMQTFQLSILWLIHLTPHGMSTLPTLNSGSWPGPACSPSSPSSHPVSIAGTAHFPFLLEMCCQLMQRFCRPSLAWGMLILLHFFYNNQPKLSAFTVVAQFYVCFIFCPKFFLTYYAHCTYLNSPHLYSSWLISIKTKPPAALDYSYTLWLLF